MTIRRLLSSAICAVLIVQLTAPVATATAYSYSCSTGAGHIPDTFIAHIFRDGHYYPTYDGVSGQAYVRPLQTCVPTATFGDESFVNLANIQGGGAFAQLGYTVCQAPTGTPGCGTNSSLVPSDTSPHFWWTCSDTSGGRPCLADGMGGLPAPVLNHQYTFKITDGGSVWFYYVKDLGTGNDWQWTSTNHQTSNATEVWWGTEVTFASSALGTNQGSPDLFIRRMQYHPTGDVWHTVSEQGSVYEINTAGFVFPSYTLRSQWWHDYTEESYYPSDTMQSHTHLH